MKKRILYTISILIIILFLFIGYARFIEPNQLIVKEVTIKTKKKIKPFTIVFFTDTHFGKNYDVTHMKKIVEKINKEKPDIVLFGGDLLDNFARDQDNLDLTYLKQEFSNINANFGKYAVWGNHDYGGGTVRIYEEFMASSGFTILDNDSVILKDYGIQLVGYDDHLMGYSDPSLYQIKSNLYNVIFAHEPVVSQLIESDSENFLLTGHTHGGQINIPFLTEHFLPEGSGQFKKGLYTAEEINTSTSLTMYTSSGIGTTRYPFRFLNTPEIIKVQLQSK